ncbi:MAG: methyltransferase domain-containing protein [Specibacter sp.]
MDTRSHFRDPLIIAATIETAAAGLWDVEERALAAVPPSGASLEGSGPRHGLLDLGCGSARIAANNGAAFETIVLVDFSPELLELASEAVKSRNPSADVETLCVDATGVLTLGPNDDAGSEAFWRRARDCSLVTAGNYLCYIKGRGNRIRALQNLADTLRNDAILLISNHVVPSLDLAFEALDVDAGKLLRAAEDPSFADALLDTDSGDGSFVHWFTKELLASEINAAGLGILHSEHSGDGLRVAFLCAPPAPKPPSTGRRTR